MGRGGESPHSRQGEALKAPFLKRYRRRDAALVESGGGKAMLHVTSTCVQGEQHEKACQEHVHPSPVTCDSSHSAAMQEIPCSSPEIQELAVVMQNKINRSGFRPLYFWLK